MKRFSGLHRVGTTDHQKAIAALDRACSVMIREGRDCPQDHDKRDLVIASDGWPLAE